MRLIGCSSSRYSKSGDMSTIQESEVSSACLEKQEPLTNHPLKEKIINLPEEEPRSAFNESIDEEQEDGPIGPNHLYGNDEEENEAPNPFLIMEKGHDSLSSSSDKE